MRWARSERGKFIRLTALERHYVVDAHNVARMVTTYDLHVCDDEDRVRHNEAMADQEVQRAKFAELQDRLWEAALKYPCTRCGVEVGVRCLNLTERAKGNAVDTKWPHDGRVPEPVRIEIHETLDLR